MDTDQHTSTKEFISSLIIYHYIVYMILYWHIIMARWHY